MIAATDWLAQAPEGLANLIKRLTWHHKVRWEAPDYIEAGEWGDNGDGREVTTDPEKVEAFSSKTGALFCTPMHALVLDIDVPAWLVPSSTPGHSHLYVDLSVTEDDLWDFLDKAAAIGLVEVGYVSACKSRGMTSVRAPWIVKGQEPSRTVPNAADAPGESA